MKKIFEIFSEIFRNNYQSESKLLSCGAANINSLTKESPNGEINENRSNQTQEIPIEVPIDDKVLSSQHVVSVSVIGIEQDKASTIHSLLSVKTGGHHDRLEVSADVQRLLMTGEFSNVGIKIEQTREVLNNYYPTPKTNSYTQDNKTI
jgi:outer membrane protein assembly factor BamA